MWIKDHFYISSPHLFAWERTIANIYVSAKDDFGGWSIYDQSPLRYVEKLLRDKRDFVCLIIKQSELHRPVAVYSLCILNILTHLNDFGEKKNHMISLIY